jgi:hypothetical protein
MAAPQETQDCESGSSQSPAGEEKIDSSRRENAGRIVLSEDEALAYARAHPAGAEPLYIALGQKEPDNPRNWASARKYYVATLASMLNVLT